MSGTHTEEISHLHGYLSVLWNNETVGCKIIYLYLRGGNWQEAREDCIIRSSQLVCFTKYD